MSAPLTTVPKGVMHVPVRPFNADRSVDYATFEKLVDWHVRQQPSSMNSIVAWGKARQRQKTLTQISQIFTDGFVVNLRSSAKSVAKVLTLTLEAFCTVPGYVHAAEFTYPSRPIRILIPFPAGGSTDLLARMVGQRLTDAWGQPTVPDNRVGANAILASEIAAKATPDGHTLLMVAIGHAANASLYRKLPYDTLNDFSPIIAVGDVPIFLALNPQVKATTVKELIALAKAKPGGLNCASGGVGASHHLAGELFRQMTGTDFQHIQYKGGGPALIELVGGRVDMMFTPVSTAIQHVKGGRLRAIAVTSPQRLAITPELPTIAEAGVPGYESRAWYGLVGPGRMSRPLVTQLNSEIDRGLKSSEGRDKLTGLGIIPMGGSAAEFDTFIRRELEKYAKVAKSGGIRID